MKITCRRYLYKIVEPSQKGRVLTTWQEEDPIEKFEFIERIKLPLGVTDTEINNMYREITKKRAEKLMAERLGIPEMPVPEEQETPNESEHTEE